MNEIIISPEYLKLVKEVKQLKENIADLYEERDQLIYHTCRYLESEYMSKIGVWEYKLYQIECGVLRIKRKIELYQMKINRQEVPNEENIEKILDEEYIKYTEKLNKMSDDIEQALSRKNCGVLSNEDSNEIKVIYRKLIKKLHPDLNKENKDKNKNLLLQVTRAYENGDLETLKNIELLLDDIIEKDDLEISELEELKQSKIKYEKIVEELILSISKIKKSFPYNKRQFLENNILVKKKRTELEEEIKQYKEVYASLNDILEKLKGESNG